MKRLLLLPAIALAALLVACSDDDEDLGQRADAEETPVANGLQFVFDSVGNNLDVNQLRPYLSDELDSMSDDDIAHQIICFPSDVLAEAVDKQIEENGETATLTVHWEVTGDAAATEEQSVERTWEFRRIENGEDPGYEVTGLPEECPFVSDDSEGGQDDADELEDSDSAEGTPDPS